MEVRLLEGIKVVLLTLTGEDTFLGLFFHHTSGLVSDPSTSFAKDSSSNSGVRADDLLEMSTSNISRAVFFYVAASLASPSFSSVALD